MNIKKFIYQKSKIFNLGQIFGGYAWQPFFLLIHLTLNCNCRCQYCYQKDNPFYQKRNGFIKPADLEKILTEIRSSFLIKPNLHFFGGEPLINPYFGHLLDLADKYRMETSLATNGVLLDRYSAQILKSNLNQMNVSIDGLDSIHDQIRGVKGSFEKVIDNIKKLRKKEGPKRKIINVNCLILPDNHQRLVDLAVYFKDNRVDIDVLAFQHLYFNRPKNRPAIDLTVLKSQIDKLNKLRAKFNILVIPKIRFEDLTSYYLLEKKAKFKNNCNIPWLGLNILPNLEATPGGGVLGCNQVVGDLKKQTLKEIWNGPLMRQFRKNIIKKGLPRICFHCCHRQYY